MNRRCVIFAGLAVPPHLCQDIGPQDVILAADAAEDDVRVIFVDGIPAGSKIR